MPLTYVLTDVIWTLVLPPPKKEDFIEPRGGSIKVMEIEQRNMGTSEKGPGPAGCTRGRHNELHEQTALE